MANKNIISALLSLSTSNNLNLPKTPRTGNRINNIGTPLEEYVKNLFLGNAGRENHISYEGSKNHPPDFILKNGDAFEVKKIDNANAADIQLNSSFPKDKLYVKDPKITEECKKCESAPWTEKDIFYVIGVAPEDRLKHIFFIHGKCIAASYDYYEKFFKAVKSYINKGPFIFEDTKEFGRINNIDPLGITKLRIRSMSLMKNPFKIFDFCTIDQNKGANVFCLMTKSKYTSFEENLRNQLTNSNIISVSDVNTEDPETKTMMSCKFIKFFI
tara:strand:- start:71 stop:886 length:816 start_codon:yes stop_codon:yes gene_type:complete